MVIVVGFVGDTSNGEPECGIGGFTSTEVVSSCLQQSFLVSMVGVVRGKGYYNRLEMCMLHKRMKQREIRVCSTTKKRWFGRVGRGTIKGIQT